MLSAILSVVFKVSVAEDGKHPRKRTYIFASQPELFLIFWVFSKKSGCLGSYHRCQFYATIGGFSSEENCVSAAVNHRYHIWKCTR